MPSTYGSILSYLKGTGIGQVHVVTSKGVWPPQSLLQSLVVKSRFVGRGFQASKGLINLRRSVDWPLNKKTTESQALLNTASAKEIARNLEEFHAQAFDDPTVRARDLSSSKRITV